MEINQNLAKLYEHYQKQKQYQQDNYYCDLNGDQKIDANDINIYINGKETLLLEQMDILRNEDIFDFNNDGKTDFMDLFDIGSKCIDIDGDGQVDDMERAFFIEYMPKITESIRINFENSSLSDLMNFENVVSQMSDVDKRFWKSAINSFEKTMKKSISSTMLKNKKGMSLDDFNNLINTHAGNINEYLNNLNSNTAMENLREFWQTTYSFEETCSKSVQNYLKELESRLIEQALKGNNLTKADIEAAKKEVLQSFENNNVTDDEEALVNEPSTINVPDSADVSSTEEETAVEPKTIPVSDEAEQIKAHIAEIDATIAAIKAQQQNRYSNKIATTASEEKELQKLEKEKIQLQKMYYQILFEAVLQSQEEPRANETNYEKTLGKSLRNRSILFKTFNR